jgi:hypothetical protein
LDCFQSALFLFGGHRSVPQRGSVGWRFMH